MRPGLKNRKLLKKGAEASLFLESWQDHQVVMKQRLPKGYRLPEVDAKIRNYRTTHESQLIHHAKEAGVPTPKILMIDLPSSNIIMEFVEGKQIKQILDSLSPADRQYLLRQIGELIGRLHSDGIVHGDLTTSNMILTPSGKVVFVDFGLAEKTTELEMKGVDLHLMRRAFKSVHFRHAEECFTAVLDGYEKVVGEDMAKSVLKKIDEIESRGRYISGRYKEEQ